MLCGTVAISWHDRDAKYTQSFRAIIASGQVAGPLTDREIEELDAFLLAEDGLENGASTSLQRPPYFRPFQYFGHTGSRGSISP